MPTLIERCAQALDAGGEAALIGCIFEAVGTGPRFCVEFGASGRGPTWHLRREHDWQALLMDVNPPADQPEIRRETVTAENVNALFAKYGVPAEYDFLCIDVDGNDYWIWRALDESRFSARVVCIEYNCHIPPTRRVSLPYEPRRTYQHDKYYGASAAAFHALAAAKGYSLVCVEGFMNLFFVRSERLDPADRGVPLERLFHYPLDIERIIREQHFNWRPSWIAVPDPDPDDGHWVNV